jgi:hypothetical protein
MARAKWIFGAPPAVTPDSTPKPIPVISSADAKKFGLENVRIYFIIYSLASSFLSCTHSLAIHGEHLACLAPHQLTDVTSPVMPTQFYRPFTSVLPSGTLCSNPRTTLSHRTSPNHLHPSTPHCPSYPYATSRNENLRYPDNQQRPMQTASANCPAVSFPLLPRPYFPLSAPFSFTSPQTPPTKARWPPVHSSTNSKKSTNYSALACTRTHTSFLIICLIRL